MPKVMTKVDDLRNKPDEFIDCYDYGHSWAKLGTFRWGGFNSILRRSFCTRCVSERHDYFSRSRSTQKWRFEGRRYFYSDGYLKQGEGRVQKIDIQNESLRREEQNANILDEDAEWLAAPDLQNA